MLLSSIRKGPILFNTMPITTTFMPEFMYNFNDHNSTVHFTIIGPFVVFKYLLIILIITSTIMYICAHTFTYCILVMPLSKATDPDHDISDHHYYDNCTIYSYYCSN